MQGLQDYTNCAQRDLLKLLSMIMSGDSKRSIIRFIQIPIDLYQQIDWWAIRKSNKKNELRNDCSADQYNVYKIEYWFEMDAGG